MSRSEDGLPVIPQGREEDLRGLEHADDADLVLFLAGNQFMAMDELLAAFQGAHPEVRRIFCETLPPRLELLQILAGGAVFQDRVVPGNADVYASVSRQAMETLAEGGFIGRGGFFVYLHNRVVLLVPKGNPARVLAVPDLARDDVRVSQPNPELENIGEHIVNMYRQAGGEDLVRRVMEEKKAAGSTLMTTVHHRETPARLLAGEADTGPVWATEAAFARAQDLPLESVEPGEALDQRDKVNYYACRLDKGPNPKNADKFLEFLRGKEAKRIYASYGFTPA